MISENEFQNIRQELTGRDPLIKRVKLSNISLDDKSIENLTIHVGEHPVPVTRNFFTRLAQVVNLNMSLLNKMEKNKDKLIQIKLLEAVKSYAESRDGGKEFLLIGDPEAKRITNIVVADRYTRLTNETLFKTAESLLNEVPDLSIQSIDRNGGDVSINLIHAQDKGFERLGPDEVFRFGISLVNNPNQSRIDEFIYRLGCDNGMMTRTPTGSGPDIGGPSGGVGAGPESFRDILNQAHIWASNGFIPVSFEDRLHRAMDTHASLGEMSSVWDSVEKSIREEDPDRKLWICKAAKVQLFPHLEETERRLLAKGVNPNDLTDAQKKFIKTGRTVWDLVNDLTWLGSHQSTFDMINNGRFKLEGGKLFVKNYDLEHVALTTL